MGGGDGKRRTYEENMEEEEEKKKENSYCWWFRSNDYIVSKTGVYIYRFLSGLEHKFILLIELVIIKIKRRNLSLYSKYNFVGKYKSYM